MRTKSIIVEQYVLFNASQRLEFETKVCRELGKSKTMQKATLAEKKEGVTIHFYLIHLNHTIIQNK